MQEARNAERMYDFFRHNGNGPRCIATFDILLLSRPRCLLLLLMLRFFPPWGFHYFLIIDLLKNFSGLCALRTKMTAAVNLGCGRAKNMNFISAHNGQWTPILLFRLLKGPHAHR